MKKINSGYYSTIYNGVEIKVCKVEKMDSNTSNQWFFIVDNKKVEDWHDSKKSALESAKYFIDHPNEY